MSWGAVWKGGLEPMMARYVLEDLTEVFCYLPWALAGGCICLLLLGLWRRGRCGAQKAPALAFALLIMYLIILSGLVFFGRPPGSRHGLALGLFDTVGNLRSNAYVLENVLLFLPFGLFYGYFAHRHACQRAVLDGNAKRKTEPLSMRQERRAVNASLRKAVCCGALSCLLSMAIELMQYLFSRGFTQLDDVLTNTLGGIAGYALYQLYRGLRGKRPVM